MYQPISLFRSSVLFALITFSHAGLSQKHDSIRWKLDGIFMAFRDPELSGRLLEINAESEYLFNQMSNAKRTELEKVIRSNWTTVDFRLGHLAWYCNMIGSVPRNIWARVIAPSDKSSWLSQEPIDFFSYCNVPLTDPEMIDSLISEMKRSPSIYFNHLALLLAKSAVNNMRPKIFAALSEFSTHPDFSEAVFTALDSTDMFLTEDVKGYPNLTQLPDKVAKLRADATAANRKRIDELKREMNIKSYHQVEDLAELLDLGYDQAPVQKILFELLKTHPEVVERDPIPLLYCEHYTFNKPWHLTYLIECYKWILNERGEYSNRLMSAIIHTIGEFPSVEAERFLKDQLQDIGQQPKGNDFKELVEASLAIEVLRKDRKNT
ncbi:MAG TPA: hypothetical protein VGK59_14020, partial [Ohtaekwangia sp.]